MRNCISFCAGLLAVGHCNHISKSNQYNSFRRINTLVDHQGRRRPNSFLNHPAIQVRGGSFKSSPTRINLSAKATMASLFAGSIGGAIGVGVAYPFDTLSTKAQIGESHMNFVKNIGQIWKNDGVRGFFEGVMVTVRFILWSLKYSVTHISSLLLFHTLLDFFANCHR